jgi:LysR family transcriptional regulator, glycine cleavage system transcriptional activator
VVDATVSSIRGAAAPVCVRRKTARPLTLTQLPGAVPASPAPDLSAFAMTHGLPSLTALRAFETVCRTGGVKRAAAELNVTAGAVSRQLGRLAAELGLELFRRQGNRLELTADGERVRDAVADGFGLLQRRLEAIAHRPGKRPIMLGCSPTFAMNWLLPRMSRWEAAQPGLTLSVVPLPNGPGSAPSGAVDAWIDQGRWPADERIVTAPFLENLTALAMSADFARCHGPFRGPEDLRALPALANRTRPEGLDDWFGDPEYSTREDQVVREEVFDDLFLSLLSARVGLGYLLAPAAYLEDELADGRMVAPFGVKPRAVPYFLAWWRTAEPARLAPLLDWLRREGRWPAGP